MQNPEIDKYGNKYWENEDGQYHRLDGPAVEYKNGANFWYQNDNLHRLDGPAIEYPDGTNFWFIEDIEYTEEEFTKKISEMKVQNPEIDEWGNKFWRNEKGEYHRIDGPAYEGADGTKFWYQNGELHRVDGPAVEWVNGHQEWWVDGLRFFSIRRS